MVLDIPGDDKRRCGDRRPPHFGSHFSQFFANASTFAARVTAATLSDLGPGCVALPVVHLVCILAGLVWGLALALPRTGEKRGEAMMSGTCGAMVR